MERTNESLELRNPSRRYLMHVWGHSYEIERQNTWPLIETFCGRIGGRDEIWYAANIEIADYLDDAVRLQFSENSDRVCNPNRYSVRLEVDGERVEIPSGTVVWL